MPRPRRPRVDLPRPRPAGRRSLGRAQGPAQHRRHRRDPIGAAVPRAGRPPEHRAGLQLRRARERPVHRDGVRAWSDAARRRSRNGKPPTTAIPIPCPPSHAITFMLSVLPAFGYLHQQGLLYCDFKPDNVIRTVRLVEADRHGRRVPHGRHHQRDLRDTRLPGSGDRRHRAHDPLRPLHGGPHARRAVHAHARLPQHVRQEPAADGGRPAVPGERLALPLPGAGDRRRSRRSVPVRRRDGRATRRRAARDRGRGVRHAVAGSERALHRRAPRWGRRTRRLARPSRRRSSPPTMPRRASSPRSPPA